jgi:hypothetical protein
VSSTGAVAFQKGKRTKELGVDRPGGMDILTNPDESGMNVEESPDPSVEPHRGERRPSGSLRVPLVA